MEPVSIYEWVSEHNPSSGLSYGKGWWDYVTFLYHLDELYGSNRTTVVSTYELATPPPRETLLMPVARLETDRAVFIMKAQFDGIEPAWTVSVIRDGAGRIPSAGSSTKRRNRRRTRSTDSRRSGCFPATRRARTASRPGSRMTGSSMRSSG